MLGGFLGGLGRGGGWWDFDFLGLWLSFFFVGFGFFFVFFCRGMVFGGVWSKGRSDNRLCF